MKKLLRPLGLAGLLLMAVLFGLMLGKGGGLAGLWEDVRSLWAHPVKGLDPDDPVLKAGLPEPDPIGLRGGPYRLSRPRGVLQRSGAVEDERRGNGPRRG